MIEKMVYGGGDGNGATGTFTATSGTVSVDVGFRPSYLVVYKMDVPSSGDRVDWTAPSMVCFYDKDLTTSYQFRAYIPTGTTQYTNAILAPPNLSNSDCIAEITSTGFTFKGDQYYAGETFRYIAVA